MAQHPCPHCEETIDADAEVCPACGYFEAAHSCERHPDRAADGQCVICGRALCEECNHPQTRHFVCDTHADVPLMSGWAQVYSAADDLDASLIRDNLTAEGIEARVLSQRDHYSFAVDLGELNEVRVLVPAFDYEPARQLLESHTGEEGEVTFACPNCGEAYESGETRCSVCGAALPVIEESA